MKGIILDLCGGTGSWSKPWRDAGYDVRVVTLPRHDVRDYVPPAGVFGILAAPPCTEFTLAKANKPRNFAEGIQCVSACLRIVWECRIAGTLKFWALENPVGFLRQFLGAPAFTFEHWQFGDAGVKPTDLWGYFRAPRARVKRRPENLTKRYPNGKSNGTNWTGKGAAELGLSRAALRAMTPPGFAQAFYEANKN